MSSEKRRDQVRKIREEGREARLKGVHRQNVPNQYEHSMDKIHWVLGWDDADIELLGNGNE